MPKYEIKGWVEVEVFAEIEAKNIHEARRIWNKSEGCGVPDEFEYREGNWVSPVNLESIKKAEQ